MNWFDTSGLTSLARTALKEAQKTLDKALDIQDDDEEEAGATSASDADHHKSPESSKTPQKESSDFLSSWGLTVSAESANDEAVTDKPVVTEGPSKSSQQSMWSSFAGSFFENPNEGSTSQPPKAKSMNVIADAKYGSQDDLFSKSQLVMSDTDPASAKSHKDDDRRGSSRSNQLSLISSRNSSDSVEVLSQSMKTTPDSEVSIQTMSHSSSFGHKLNSESVEILPDSLVSPSSIECLGFDSCSERNSSSSSNLSSVSDKKSTPVGERIETADSVSLVPDDDDDTISYNSVSECTAPTVLDSDNKFSPFSKPIRNEPQRKIDKELVSLDTTFTPQKMQVSENSSDGGSWSDRTLHADDSINFEADEQKKEEQEDIFMEKLSDSSSFYNVNVSSSELIHSESTVFVDVDRHCRPDGSEHKDGSVKERVSPISSDSKSESLVKIGSDRTSGHTSGDEIETATSSDIEIIPSPNGDNGQSFRNSPAKYTLKSKFDGRTSPNLVDLVLGKSLASKIRGHNRELSEVSLQSNTSDESQGSENDRLMRRLCEMAEVLEARENRLMEMSRSNADLSDCNAELRSQLETLRAREGDGSIVEDYTQRMSALEKKFQQAIREKDQLRKQLDSMKADSGRKTSSEFENALKEKDDVIAQLQEEGEKLAKQQLQHSNIIKKLRVKEKDNEQVIKGLRDKVAELSGELDRVKRALATREEAELSQMEAVYRLTAQNKRLETELNETKSALEDATQRLESNRTSLEAARKEVVELQRTSSELERRRGVNARTASERDRLAAECERLRQEVTQLRAEMVQEQTRHNHRERSLRAELQEAIERAVTAEEAGRSEAAPGEGAGQLLAQLAALQGVVVEKERVHGATVGALRREIAELQASLAKALELERASREENLSLQSRLAAGDRPLESARGDSSAGLRDSSAGQEDQEEIRTLRAALDSKTREMERLKEEYETTISQLRARVSETERALIAEKEALDVERKRNAILQEQLSQFPRPAPSPPHSVASDCLSVSHSAWTQDEYHVSLPPSAFCIEETMSQLTRKEGECRALTARVSQLKGELDAVRRLAAKLQAEVDELKTVQEQYDALLQMYGEKEEQLQEVRLDLDDVTALYKAQLDELVALREAAGRK